MKKLIRMCLSLTIASAVLSHSVQASRGGGGMPSVDLAPAIEWDILVTLQNADFRANTAISVQGAFVKECPLPFKQMQRRNEIAVTLPKGGA